MTRFVRWSFFLLGFFGTTAFLSFAQESSVVKIACFSKERVIEIRDGQLTGFGVEVMEYIAERNGWKLAWHHTTLPEALTRLRNGEADLIVPLGYEEERDLLFDYSEQELLNTWGQVFAGPDSRISSIVDLQDKKIGYIRDSFFYPILKDLLRQFGIDGKFVEFSSYEALFGGLRGGVVDAAIGDRLEAYASGRMRGVAASPIVFHPFGLHVVGPEGDPRGVLTTIDQELRRLKEDGNSFYYRSQQRWFGQGASEVFPRWLGILLLILLLGMVLAYLWVYFLRREVRVRTREVVRLQNLLKNIIDSMPSVLIGLDREARVVQWNRRAQELSGIKAEDAMGRPAVELLPEFASDFAHIENCLNNNLPYIQHKRPRESRTGLLYEDVVLYPLISKGAVGAVIRVDDVTEKVKLEEMMIQSEKMLSIGGLAAGMAHEINNPLAGIIQNASVIRNRLRPDGPANQRTAKELGTEMDVIKAYVECREIDEMLRYIADSGKRTSKIVKNMLGFVRKGDLQKLPTDIAQLLSDTLDLVGSDYHLRKQYECDSIQVERDYDS
ncbi:MAG TPA: transporter substrate-binding domain-containing protein, partial [Sediminispirochaeta sp.]|nr:transporter substrate-binding domain-containing protein [Sediminispirochaeta sp.]